MQPLHVERTNAVHQVVLPRVRVASWMRIRHGNGHDLSKTMESACGNLHGCQGTAYDLITSLSESNSNNKQQLEGKRGMEILKLQCLFVT